MKILIVASFNKGYFAPFILEQVEALRRTGIECEFFGVQGKGLKGYLKNLSGMKSAIIHFHPDLIHAHYGLSGLLANLQRRVPVVTTYHGSDINDPKVLWLSKIAMKFSAWNIFVSKKTVAIAKPKRRWSLIPCGIDLPKNPAELPDMSKMLETGKIHILFAGAFDNKVKNYPLAKSALEKLKDKGVDAQLIELKGYSREEVNALMYACDALLMTSFTEGSPQVIKESMACGCSIVSVDVGDVKEVFGNVPGNYICSYDAKDIATKLRMAFAPSSRLEGLTRIMELGLTNDIVGEKLVEIYKRVIANGTC